MTRVKFDRELRKLQDDLISMASLLDKNREYFTAILTERNPALAEQTAHIDDEIQKYKNRLESQCLMLFISQQPVAGDMRRISATLKLITHLKRMSGQITAAVRIVASLLDDDVIDHIPHLAALSEASGAIVRHCVTALIHGNLVEAAQMSQYDDRIDSLFREVRKDMAAYLRAGNGHEEAVLDLLLAAKYMEKVGDHAVSAARWIIFSITGTR